MIFLAVNLFVLLFSPVLASVTGCTFSNSSCLTAGSNITKFNNGVFAASYEAASYSALGSYSSWDQNITVASGESLVIKSYLLAETSGTYTFFLYSDLAIGGWVGAETAFACGGLTHQTVAAYADAGIGAPFFDASSGYDTYTVSLTPGYYPVMVQVINTLPPSGKFNFSITDPSGELIQDTNLYAPSVDDSVCYVAPVSTSSTSTTSTSTSTSTISTSTTSTSTNSTSTSTSTTNSISTASNSTVSIPTSSNSLTFISSISTSTASATATTSSSSAFNGTTAGYNDTVSTTANSSLTYTASSNTTLSMTSSPYSSISSNSLNLTSLVTAVTGSSNTATPLFSNSTATSSVSSGSGASMVTSVVVTEIDATVLYTITSCGTKTCYPVVTSSVHKTITSYTTYCPLTALKNSVSGSESITAASETEAAGSNLGSESSTLVNGSTTKTNGSGSSTPTLESSDVTSSASIFESHSSNSTAPSVGVQEANGAPTLLKSGALTMIGFLIPFFL